jgi:hypothetical protein
MISYLTSNPRDQVNKQLIKLNQMALEMHIQIEMIMDFISQP